MQNQFKTLGRVKMTKGTILSPENAGLCFILSVHNMAGKPEGNPLQTIFDRKWKQIRSESRGWFVTKTGAYKLGSIYNIAVQSNVEIISMLCQDEKMQFNLPAVEKCLKEVCKLAKFDKATVHISSLLVEAIPELPELAKKYLSDEGVNLTFCEEVGSS